MGTVLQFKRRQELTVMCPDEAAMVILALPPYMRQMVYDYPLFRMETDGEYATRLKRLES